VFIVLVTTILLWYWCCVI